MRTLPFALVAVVIFSGVASAQEPSADGGSGPKVLAAQVYGAPDGADLRMKLGAKSAKRISTGVYQVKFKRRVDTCFPSATLFYPGNAIAAQPQFETLKDTMIVAIKNAAGQFVDDRFWLVVNCPG